MDTAGLESLAATAQAVGAEEALDGAELLDALVLLRQVRTELSALEPALIAAARAAGVSWQALAPALGVASRQAAERRYLRAATALPPAARPGGIGPPDESGGAVPAGHGGGIPAGQGHGPAAVGRDQGGGAVPAGQGQVPAPVGRDQGGGAVPVGPSAGTRDGRVRAERDRRAGHRAVARWANDHTADLRRLAGQIAALTDLGAAAGGALGRLHDALADPDASALPGLLAATQPHLDDHPELAAQVGGVVADTDEVRRQTQQRRA